eukprot:comp23410_c0_seq2/m.38888 comp23410_c0_seq2/g.38888  ORF comp23410_c0_seq2/g.38888 comp23410_c0_seq2/m.38888 type:complete len:551 (-) comp23410_c0_seq2:1992-3644(-)
MVPDTMSCKRSLPSPGNPQPALIQHPSPHSPMQATAQKRPRTDAWLPEDDVTPEPSPGLSFEDACLKLSGLRISEFYTGDDRGPDTLLDKSHREWLQRLQPALRAQAVEKFARLWVAKRKEWRTTKTLKDVKKYLQGELKKAADQDPMFHRPRLIFKPWSGNLVSTWENYLNSANFEKRYELERMDEEVLTALGEITEDTDFWAAFEKAPACEIAELVSVRLPHLSNRIQTLPIEVARSPAYAACPIDKNENLGSQLIIQEDVGMRGYLQLVEYSLHIVLERANRSASSSANAPYMDANLPNSGGSGRLTTPKSGNGDAGVGGGEVFNASLKLLPPKMALSNRFYRKFGSERFMRTKVILPDRSIGPSVMGQIAEALFENPFVLGGRKYEFLCGLDDKKDADGSEANQQTKRACCLFATEGVGIDPISIESVIDWHIPMRRNGSMQWAKFAARFSLGFSRTFETVVVENVVVIPDIYGQEGKKESCMTDGCAGVGLHLLQIFSCRNLTIWTAASEGGHGADEGADDTTGAHRRCQGCCLLERKRTRHSST